MVCTIYGCWSWLEIHCACPSFNIVAVVTLTCLWMVWKSSWMAVAATMNCARCTHELTWSSQPRTRWERNEWAQWLGLERKVCPIETCEHHHIFIFYRSKHIKGSKECFSLVKTQRANFGGCPLYQATKQRENCFYTKVGEIYYLSACPSFLVSRLRPEHVIWVKRL